MITGEEEPDAGSIKIGETVQLAYVDQSRDDLDADKTVYEEITGGVEHMVVGNREINGRAYVACFNFKGADQQKLVGKLSGGERNRVHLAKLLKTGGNVLLLDEPTNDLDVDTLRALEDAPRVVPRLRRRDLATIAGSSIASPPTSSPSRATARCAGSRATSPSTRSTSAKELGESGDQPHRIKYKKLA